MADQVLVQFQSDLDALKKELDEVKPKVKGIGSDAKKAGKDMSDSFKGAGDNINKVLTGIASKIAAAFAVSQIIAFGKESLKAFENAELAARKLETAVRVAGGSLNNFNRLIAQSGELQKKSIFGDDTIQAAQTLALQFGLTAAQVENLLPLVSDFASATGQDLASAMQSVLIATNGQTRGLKQFGIVLKDAGSQEQNLANITDALSAKFKGQSEIIANTASGRIKQLANNYDDLQESIGELIALSIDGFLEKTNDKLITINETISSESLSRWEKFALIFNSLAGSKLGQLESELLLKRAKLLDEFKQRINEQIEVGKKSEAQRAETVQGLSDELEKLNQEKKITDDLIERKNILARAINKLNAIKGTINETTKEGNDAESAEIRNIFFLKKAIEEQNKIIEDENSTFEKINAAIAERLKLGEELKTVLGEETEAMKKAREAAEAAEAARQKAFEEEVKRQEQINQGVLGVSANLTRANKIEIAELQNKLDTQEISEKEFTDRRLELLNEDRENLKNQLDAKLISELDYAEAVADIDAQIIATRNKLREEDLKKAQEAAKQREQVEKASQELLINSLQTAIDINTEFRKAEVDAQLALLEEKKKNQQISDAEFAAERKRILTAQFESDKKAAIQKAFIDGAAAVISSLKTDPTGQLALIVAATSALQIAKIQSTPIPQFHTGEIDIRPRKKNRKGEFDAKLIEGESVIAARPTAKYSKELEAINSMKFEDLIYTKYIIPALQVQKREFEKQQNKDFGNNIAKSLMLNAKLNDGNIVEMLKRINATSKENLMALSNLANKRQNKRTNV